MFLQCTTEDDAEERNTSCHEELGEAGTDQVIIDATKIYFKL